MDSFTLSFTYYNIKFRLLYIYNKITKQIKKYCTAKNYKVKIFFGMSILSNYRKLMAKFMEKNNYMVNELMTFFFYFFFCLVFLHFNLLLSFTSFFCTNFMFGKRLKVPQFVGVWST